MARSKTSPPAGEKARATPKLAASRTTKTAAKGKATAKAARTRKKAVEESMLEFRQAALLKVARGETSSEEVFRVIPAEHLMMED